MPDIELEHVDSSVVEAIGYDPETRTLAVKLHASARTPGRTYHFEDVPPECYMGLKAAPSKGVFFGRAIKTKFHSTQVPTQGRCGNCGDIGQVGCQCEDCGTDTYRSEE